MVDTLGYGKDSFSLGWKKGNEGRGGGGKKLKLWKEYRYGTFGNGEAKKKIIFLE